MRWYWIKSSVLIPSVLIFQSNGSEESGLWKSIQIQGHQPAKSGPYFKMKEFLSARQWLLSFDACSSPPLTSPASFLSMAECEILAVSLLFPACCSDIPTLDRDHVSPRRTGLTPACWAQWADRALMTQRSGSGACLLGWYFSAWRQTVSAPPSGPAPSIMEETGQGSVSDTVGNPAVPPAGKQSLQLTVACL